MVTLEEGLGFMSAYQREQGARMLRETKHQVETYVRESGVTGVRCHRGFSTKSAGRRGSRCARDK